MAGNDVLYKHLAAGGRRRDHIGPRLYLVGNDGIAAAVELFHAVDLYCIRSRAADVRAHGVEEVCKVNDMRLARRVLDNGAPLGKHRRQNYVHCRADRDLVKIDPCAAQSPSPGVRVDKAVSYVHVRAERSHALDMLVNGTNAEIAAAGHGGLCVAKAAEHRADEVI